MAPSSRTKNLVFQRAQRMQRRIAHPGHQGGRGNHDGVDAVGGNLGQRIAALQPGRRESRHHAGDATSQFAIADRPLGIDQRRAFGPALDGAADQVGIAAALVQRELFGHGVLSLPSKDPGAGA
jgi:hypothetical protein